MNPLTAQPDPISDELTTDPHRPDHEQARAALIDLLRACEITRVINVDDSNQDVDNQDIDPTLVVGALTSGQLTIDMLLSRSDTTRLVAVDPDGQSREIDEILYDLRMQPPNVDETVLRELTSAARLASRASVAPKNDPNLTLTVDLEARDSLQDLLHGAVSFEALTLAQWRAGRDAILADQNPALILFDRDFGLEDAHSTTGDDLIADVIRQDHRHIYCAMLTHSATSADVEHMMMREIAQSLDLDRAQLIVMAKEQVRNNPMTLVTKIKAAMLARTLMELREITVNAMVGATNAGVTILNNLDAYTLLSMAQAAHHEGLHEADNMIRVATTSGRRYLTRQLRTDLTATALDRLRQVNSAAPRGHGLLKPDGLEAYDHDDNFDDSDYLSALHLPITPGDIFQLVDVARLLAGTINYQAQRFVLITQHCDTIIRPGGVRMGSPSMLVVAPVKKVDSNKNTRQSDVELPRFDTNNPDDKWYARLAERTQVPTICLDACALSVDGAARIVFGQDPPSGITPGWRNRHEKLQEWAGKCLNRFKKFDEQNLSSDARALVVNALTGCSKDLHHVKAAIDTNTKTVAFGVRRIRRLTDPRTRALLTLASHHLGRPAIEGPLLTDLDGTR